MQMNEDKKMMCIFKNNDKMAIFGQLNHFNGDPSLKVSCEKEENWEVKELQSD